MKVNKAVVASALASLVLGTSGCAAKDQRQPAGEPASARTTAAAAGTTGSVRDGASTETLAAQNVGIIQYPSISPDGSTIVFAWAGDLWQMPSKGGVATRLTAHAADERRSAFSPDGKMLAFESDREGGRNLFVMPVSKSDAGLVAGQARRVTALDRAVNLAGWSSDGKELLFNANLDATLYRSNRMYRVSVEAEGTHPVTRLTDAYGFMPRMTQDGSAVLFTRGRADFNRPKYEGSGQTDIYRMNLKDGSFKQVTKSPRTDGDGFPLPDGSVVFMSSRSGTNNVWRIPAGGDDGNAVQLTSFAPRVEEVTIGHGVRDLAVNAQGTLAAFVVWDTLYTLDLTQTGSQPTALKATASPDGQDNENQRLNLAREVSEAAISPDGKTIAEIARGEVFVRSMDENRPTRRVTSTHGRERGLVWSPDGRVLWFSSDEEGVSQIYYATVSLAREDIAPKDDEKKDEDEAKKDEGKKTDDAKKSDGEKKDDGAEKKDDKPVKKKIDYAKRWNEALRFDVKKLDLSCIPTGRNDGVLGQELGNPVPSPDGKKLLVTRGLGDLVLVDLKAKTAKVLIESWNDPSVSWASDSRHIVYAIEDLDFNSDIFIMDTQGSPDSPLSKGVNVTRHPDLDMSPRLSTDGKVLYFLSERGNQNFTFDVYAIMLDRKLEGMKPYELEEYFKKAGEAAGKKKPIDPVLWDEPEAKEEKAAEEKKEEKKGEEKKDEPKKEDVKKEDGEKKPEPKPKKPKAPEPLKFDLEDSHLRVRKVVGNLGNKGSLAITTGGDRVLFVGDADGERALYSVSYKGDDRKSLAPGAASNVEVTLTGSKVSFVKTGTANVAPVAGGKVEVMAIDAPVVVQLSKQQRQKFLEAARVMGNTFYHPTLKGLNWRGITDRYLTLAQKARTNGEFDRVFEQVLGELDGSHLGMFSPATFSTPSQAVGYLGVDVVPAPGGFKVTKVIFQSPADKDGARLSLGDLITAVDGKSVLPDGKTDGLPSTDLLAALVGKAGKETLVDVVRADPASKLPKTILLTPVSSAEETDLRYRDEVRRRTAKVDELSGGKLGYLHIRSMSQPSVDDFERDLFAAAHGKQGLIIDVRDNGGGSTADILLSSLTAPNHAYTVPRGADPKTTPKDAYPRDRRLIYGYGKPINVLINENSFSNAEIFAHAIKTIQRGKLIGTATFGGVISTGATTMIDGATLRMPFRGWYLPTGEDYENNGAKPDISVAQVPEDEAKGRDAQLEAAVKELLARSPK